MNSSRSLWLFLLAVLPTIAALFSIHSAPRPVPDDTQSGWHQPSTVTDIYPNAISAQQWDFNFEETELLLEEVILTDNGSLLVNSDLAKTLKSSVAPLPKQLNDESLKRIALLINKKFPENPACQNVNCTTIAELFQQYYAFTNRTDQKSDALNSAMSPQDELNLLVRENQVRVNYFGEANARLLFGKKTRIKQYLLQRRIIKASDHLSMIEKQQQLSGLKAQFEGER